MYGLIEEFIVPPGTSVLVILPNSNFIMIWDAFIRWLAVYFFVLVPVEISFRMRDRANHW